MGTALLGLLTGLWLRSQRAVNEGAGTGRGRAACLASATLVNLVPAQQEDVDQFLCSGGRRLVADRVCARLLGRRDQGWGKEADGARDAVWPWLVFGSNAIAAYMVSELLAGPHGLVPFTSDGQTDECTYMERACMSSAHPRPGWASFAYSFTFMAVCFLPVWILYRKKIFLKV